VGAPEGFGEQPIHLRLHAVHKELQHALACEQRSSTLPCRAVHV
jgi:hypothetical protein